MKCPLFEFEFGLCVWRFSMFVRIGRMDYARVRGIAVSCCGRSWSWTREVPRAVVGP